MFLNLQNTFAIVSFMLLAVYSSVILYFWQGWKLLIYEPSQSAKVAKVSVSVIVAARNEANNVPKLLSALSQQNYPKELYEIILINDHSQDNTAQLALQHKCKNLQVLNLPAHLHGKKAAVKHGVSTAKGQLLLFTDADCCIGPNWISVFANAYQHHHTKFIAGPVRIQGVGLWAELQTLEFMSLQQSSAGAIGQGKAIMANGANMAVEKTAYQQAVGKQGNMFASGDDMFVMLELKKQNPNNIGYLKHPDAIVSTHAQTNIRSFLNQRARWAGKSTGYTDVFVILVASIVFLFNLNLCASVFVHSFALYALLLALKSIADFLVVIQSATFYGTTKLLKWFALLQFVYPWYVLLSVLLAFKPSYWKGRELQHP